MPIPTKSKKGPKFSFLLGELHDSPLAARVRTRPMFGCHAVYVDQRIVFILRQKEDRKTRRDNGVWVATQPEHNASLLRDFPMLRPVELFTARRDKGFHWLVQFPGFHATLQ